ncbi:ROK family protein [Ilyomonas limi]|uniref:ROK family protein n=1 Tax=Ilyomonas limi TaxID=2575867 RepID=A0A4U3L7D8_9BACT|nr:ROK family protein [Ilyomonas limi]TKK70359.1 ROK family protein [Ilyomonas limi]
MLLGFDIGGTKCAIVLGNQTEDCITILSKKVLPTDKPPYEMIEALFSEAEMLLTEQGITLTQIKGIGISCGGPLNSKRGIIVAPPNLPGWVDIPIVSLTEKRFGIKTFLQNDANACAVAEWKYGAGRGYENLIFLTFGTGMGAGLILDNKLYSGTNDLAGEVGHLRLSETGPVGFGKAGSFEGWCSGGGLAQIAQVKVREKLQMGEKVSFCNSLDDLPALTAKIVAEAAYAGDALAIEIYKICGWYLGRGLSLLIDILNPQIIIIGSIFGRAQDLLVPCMNAVIQQEAICQSYKHCKIVPAGLKENIGDYAALSLAVIASAKALETI